MVIVVSCWIRVLKESLSPEKLGWFTRGMVHQRDGSPKRDLQRKRSRESPKESPWAPWRDHRKVSPENDWLGGMD